MNLLFIQIRTNRMDNPGSDSGIKSVTMTRFIHGALKHAPDLITVEAPLQMVLRHGPRGNRQLSNLAMTMRTPGQDDLLVMGYLFTENIIHSKEDILQIRWVKEDEILIELRESIKVDLFAQERNTYINSSCGICGKNQLDEIKSTIPFMLQKGQPSFGKDDILHWAEMLSASQRLFSSTGGIHAAALITNRQVHAIQEDIGRHNAVDKLIGFGLNHFAIPLTQMAMVVSARASFELVQKALMAGIPLMAAVGAPSSLAIELAEENAMTLIGFLKKDRFNIYSHPERVILG